MTEIYDSLDHLLIFSDYGNPQMHKHLAAHILISRKEIEVITPKKVFHCKGALIPSNTLHTVDCKNEPMLVFMFDETTSVAEAIPSVKPLDDSLADTIVSYYDNATQQGMTYEAYQAFVQNTLEVLNLKTSAKPMDSRILQAMNFIDTHIQEDPSLTEVASLCCLSESRFSHLFKSEAGITFKGYVILRRLDYVYTKLSQGIPITVAALEAGFSDSAHFAAINKQMFGLSATAITSDFRFHRMQS